MSSSVDLARYYGGVWRSLVALNSHREQSTEREGNNVPKSDILIEGDFTELDAEFSFVKHVRILVTREFVYVTELIDSIQTHVLQHSSGKVVKKFQKADVTIVVVPENPYTFKAKWEKTDDRWQLYELIGNATLWGRLLDNFNVSCSTPSPSSLRQRTRSIISSGDDSSDDDSSDIEDVEVVLPKCVTLCVAQAFSMWSMSTLNPGNVRKLAHINYTLTRGHAVLPSITSETEDIFDTLDDQAIYRSNSYPKLANTSTFRTFSLPSFDDLESVNVDENVFPPPGSNAQEEFSNLNLSRDNQDQTTGPNHANVDQLGSQRRRCSGYSHFCAKTLVELQLLRKIEDLRARPNDLKFLRRDARNEKFSLNLHHTPPTSRKLSYRLALTRKDNMTTTIASGLSQLHSFPVRDIPSVHPPQQPNEVSQNTTNKSSHFLSPKKLTKNVKRSLFKDDMAIGLGDKHSEPKSKNRRFLSIFASKRHKRTFSPQNTPSNQSSPITKDGLVDRNEFSGKYINKNSQENEVKSSNFIAGDNRRGALSGDIMGRKENVTISAVTKIDSERDVKRDGRPSHLKDSTSSGESTPLRQQSSSSSSGSVKKKLVKKILSPILKSTSLDDESSDRTVSPVSEDRFSLETADSMSSELPLQLIDVDASACAQELTLIDKELLIRIPWHELSTCGWMTKDKFVRSANVMAMVEFFNRIAMLVASEILAEETPTARARVVSKAIQIADKCRILGNFNSLKAVLAGLQSTPIYRLKETWKEVPSKRKRKFRDLSILMGEADNFAHYRAELAASGLSNGPCLPFLGDFLTQIAQTQTYLACRQKKKKQKTGFKKSPAPARKTESATTKQKGEENGIKVRKNGVTIVTPRHNMSVCRSQSETTPHCSPQIVARSQSARTADDSTIERDSNSELRDIKSQNKPQKRSSNKILRRLYGRQDSHESGVTLHRDTHSAEMLDIPGNDLKKALSLSSSDSIIASSASLCSNSDGAKFIGGRSQKPPLVRRRSESASNTSIVSNGGNGRTKRRLSESGKQLESKRSFFRGFVRRSLSSHSVKEGRVSRGPSSEKLAYSKSVNAISCAPVRSRASVEKINTIMSNQSARDSSISPEVPTEENGDEHGNETDGKESETPKNDEKDGQSGTELQLWKYQLAAIQYDFPSKPDGYVKYFLLNASFNTEEENYTLSLKRESPRTT